MAMDIMLFFGLQPREGMDIHQDITFTFRIKMEQPLMILSIREEDILSVA